MQIQGNQALLLLLGALLATSSARSIPRDAPLPEAWSANGHAAEYGALLARDGHRGDQAKHVDGPAEESMNRTAAAEHKKHHHHHEGNQPGGPVNLTPMSPLASGGMPSVWKDNEVERPVVARGETDGKDSEGEKGEKSKKGDKKGKKDKNGKKKAHKKIHKSDSGDKKTTASGPAHTPPIAPPAHFGTHQDKGPANDKDRKDQTLPNKRSNYKGKDSAQKLPGRMIAAKFGKSQDKGPAEEKHGGEDEKTISEARKGGPNKRSASRPLCSPETCGSVTSCSASGTESASSVAVQARAESTSSVAELLSSTLGSSSTKSLILSGAGSVTSTSAFYKWSDYASGLNLGETLTGCTAMYLVSHEGVLAAHYWESLAFAAGASFSTQVLEPLIGGQTYQSAQSQVSLASQAASFTGDAAKGYGLYIMTPKGASGDALYSKQLDLLKTSVEAIVGKAAAEVKTHLYEPLAKGSSQLGQDGAGMTLLQFKNNAISLYMETEEVLTETL